MAVNTVVNLSSHPNAGRAAREDEVERITWLSAKMGEAVSGADCVRATRTMHRPGRQMAAFHRDHDVLLTPGLATGTAVKLGWLDMMMDDADEYRHRVFHFSPFTVWFDITGQPAIMLPIGTSAEGLPIASRPSPPTATRRHSSDCLPSSKPRARGSTARLRWCARQPDGESAMRDRRAGGIRQRLSEPGRRGRARAGFDPGCQMRAGPVGKTSFHLHPVGRSADPAPRAVLKDAGGNLTRRWNAPILDPPRPAGHRGSRQIVLRFDTAP